MKTYDDIRWQQRLSHYSAAVDKLQEAVHIVAAGYVHDGEVDDLLREGLVQRFEYTQELAWKLMKDYAEYQGYTDIQGSRDAIRTALRMGIADDKNWMSTISDRNLTSHRYDENEFRIVLDRIISIYCPMFIIFRDRMKQLKEKSEEKE